MTLTYNGLSNPRNLVTLSEVPSILKISEPLVGTYATITFTFSSAYFQQSVTADSQYYLSLLGESITNVMEPSNATNRRFYISSDNNATALSFAQALRECGSLAAQFDIYVSGNVIRMRSKTVGSLWSRYPNFLQTNMSRTYIGDEAVDGSSTSDFIGGKIIVDVLEADVDDYRSYVTTLEKNWYGNECAFNVSPILSTIANYDALEPYMLKVSLQKQDGGVRSLGTITASTLVGYEANQSDRFLYNTTAQILINNSRGENGTILYTYGNTIPLTVMSPSSTASLTARCYDSVGNSVYTNSYSVNVGSRGIADYTITIPKASFDRSYTVEISLGSQLLRFKVIKPLKATEYHQRVQWRNEYSGVQLFDFTSKRSEQDSVDIETYEKGIFDLYENPSYEQKMIYSNGYSKEVTLTSHLMEKDATYVFNSLMRSKKVWTEINGKTYYIIPKSIDVAEVEGANDIYQVKFTYEYSYI